jgi:hypothetical protein
MIRKPRAYKADILQNPGRREYRLLEAIDLRANPAHSVENEMHLLPTPYINRVGHSIKQPIA